MGNLPESESVYQTILITGITGFVGTNLVNLFHNNGTYKIYGLDIVLKDLKGVEQIYDWDQLHLVPEVDAIIHLAGIAHDVHNTRSEDIYYKVNTDLTGKIYQYFCQSKASKFIFMSSVKAVVDFPNFILDETATPAPVTVYGKSKLKAEENILKNQPGNSKRWYILRPCMIHGPGNKGNLNSLYNFVKKRIPFPLGSYSVERSYLSVENLGFVLRNLIAKDVDSGIYNVADDHVVSLNNLIEIIGESLGIRPLILKIPKSLFNGLLWTSDKVKKGIISERFNKLTSSFIVSNDKIKNAIGVKELPITASEGLRKSILSFDSGYSSDN